MGPARICTWWRAGWTLGGGDGEGRGGVFRGKGGWAASPSKPPSHTRTQAPAAGDPLHAHKRGALALCTTYGPGRPVRGRPSLEVVEHVGGVATRWRVERGEVRPDGVHTGGLEALGGADGEVGVAAPECFGGAGAAPGRAGGAAGRRGPAGLPPRAGGASARRCRCSYAPRRRAPRPAPQPVARPWVARAPLGACTFGRGRRLQCRGC